MDVVKKHIVLNILQSNLRVSEVVNALGVVTYEHLYLTGGALRNSIWNHLHKFDQNFGQEDCDVVFYNSYNQSKLHEKKIEEELSRSLPSIRWNVKNQARMNLRNNHSPYSDLTDALRCFPETCSAIAVDKDWEVIAPYGIDDLLDLHLRPTDFCLNNEILVFYNRLFKKQWPLNWPLLTFQEMVDRVA